MDPRYYLCTTCGFWGPIGSAAKENFVYHTDSGEAGCGNPRLASMYGTGMISMSWYPSPYEPLSDGVVRTT
jgi:hypothetical protein